MLQFEKDVEIMETDNLIDKLKKEERMVVIVARKPKRNYRAYVN